MKRIVSFIPMVFCALGIFFTIGMQDVLATSIDGCGHSIQLIDGPDTDTTVTFQISDYEFNFSKDVYYAADSGAWTEILFDDFGKAVLGHFAGGSFMDLAVDRDSSNTIEGGDLFSRSDAVSYTHLTLPTTPYV